ncbi:MAG: hypothetical protein ACI4EC_06210 [Lachnospiraceae bacterium]
MLGIVLMILKVIGLLILCILGLFIALVLLVLFLPIPYRVWVSGDSGEIKQLVYRVKIFGIQVFPAKKNKKRRKKRARERTEAEVPTLPGDSVQDAGQESVAAPQTAPAATKTADREQQPAEDQIKQKRSKKQKRSGRKEKNTSGRDIRGMMNRVRAEFTDEGNRRALGHVFSEIRYLIRHFGPRRVRADVSFSLGDPANTGYATAALSICPFSYGKGCHILPDFEEAQMYLRGWIDLRGHVRAVHVFISGFRLLFDKDIRRIIRNILKKKQ